MMLPNLPTVTTPNEPPPSMVVRYTSPLPWATRLLDMTSNVSSPEDFASVSECNETLRKSYASGSAQMVSLPLA